MSERLPSQGETLTLPPERPEQKPRQAETAPRPDGPAKEVDQLEAIRRSVETAADQSRIETAQLSQESPATPKPTYVNQELKNITLRRTLQRLQADLSSRQRVLSKVVHQPVIRRVSAATAGTAARPSGLLGGGLCAFLGSLGYAYLAHHYGFTYNFALFILLFVAGFLLGVTLELLLHFASHRRH